MCGAEGYGAGAAEAMFPEEPPQEPTGSARPFLLLLLLHFLLTTTTTTTTSITAITTTATIATTISRRSGHRSRGMDSLPTGGEDRSPGPQGLATGRRAGLPPPVLARLGELLVELVELLGDESGLAVRESEFQEVVMRPRQQALHGGHQTPRHRRQY